MKGFSMHGSSQARLDKATPRILVNKRLGWYVDNCHFYSNNDFTVQGDFDTLDVLIDESGLRERMDLIVTDCDIAPRGTIERIREILEDFPEAKAKVEELMSSYVIEIKS